jgi:hypothetical protein
MHLKLVPLAVVGALLTTASDVSAQPVIDATRTGDHRTLQALVGVDTDLDEPQGDGATALHWAAHRNDLRAGHRPEEPLYALLVDGHSANVQYQIRHEVISSSASRKTA